MREFLPTSWILEEWEGDLRVVECVERFVGEIREKRVKFKNKLDTLLDELQQSSSQQPNI